MDPHGPDGRWPLPLEMHLWMNCLGQVNGFETSDQIGLLSLFTCSHKSTLLDNRLLVSRRPVIYIAFILSPAVTVRICIRPSSDGTNVHAISLDSKSVTKCSCRSIRAPHGLMSLINSLMTLSPRIKFEILIPRSLPDPC